MDCWENHRRRARTKTVSKITRLGDRAVQRSYVAGSLRMQSLQARAGRSFASRRGASDGSDARARPPGILGSGECRNYGTAFERRERVFDKIVY